MKKRGISPFIAVVLLIGLIIAMGVILATFFSNFSEKETKRIENEAFLMALCTEKTDLNFGRSCFVASPNSTFKVDIENEGAYSIEKINFTFFIGNSTLEFYELNSSIDKFGHGVHDINLPGVGAMEKMGYIKYLRVDNETIICDLIVVDIELKECSL